MRFNPTKLLQGLLCSTPLLVLMLAACGGGGGGDSSPGTPAASYTVGGSIAASGTLAAAGLVLRNNGGDDLTITNDAPVSYVFATPVAAGKPYNVTVLTQPSSPTQFCSVANASGTMPSSNLTTVNVNCALAYTIGGNSINNLKNTGLVLQNKLKDNLLISPADTSFSFKTPLVTADTYTVSVLTQPLGQNCSIGGGSGTVGSSDVNSVTISCLNTGLPSPDPYVYSANYGSSSDNVSVFTSASGVLSAQTAATAGNGPSAIAVAGGKYAYVANYTSGSISGFKITGGALSALSDVDGGTAGTQTSIATGSHPLAIAIHPSANFAYVANYSSNSVSVYSIDPATGALASIDADGVTAGTQTSIATRSGPISIAITPDGQYAYVANAASNNISAYSIDSTTGALTPIQATGSGSLTYIAAGATPYSLSIDPSGAYLYAANSGSTGTVGISAYAINSNGSLVPNGTPGTGLSPHAIAVNPDPNNAYVYVANTGSSKVPNSYSVWVYSISNITGQLTHGVTSSTNEVTTGTAPLSIRVDSTGQYVYVANSGSNDISVYDTTSTVGGLTQVDCGSGPTTCNGKNFKAGTAPYGIATSR